MTLRLLVAGQQAARQMRALLIRRPLDAPDEPKQLANYLTFAPVGTLVETMVVMAGRRWTIEESVTAAKGEVGLTTTRCATTTGGYRHITLAMLALAYRAVVRSRLPGAPRAGKGGLHG